jgi:histone H3/H4
MKSITRSEANFIVQPKATVKVPAKHVSRSASNLIGDTKESTGASGVSVFVAPMSSVVDRMLKMLPCPNITRLFKEYSEAGWRKVPKAIQAIGRFLKPIFRNFAKKHIKKADL